MKLKIIIFLAIILTSCETTNKKVITNKDFKNYSNDGFALIYNNDIFKKRIVSKKIDQRSLIIFNNKLKKDTDIKITNLLNEKYLIAKVGKSSKYPIFYNSVISERIATELDIDPDQPYVRVETINSNNTFVANKAKTFDEEKKVANKAPVDSISIQNISIEKDNNSKVEKVKNTKFEFIIKFADLFFEESAITLKKRLEDEYNLKDINIKKMSKNLYRVYKGPFYNLGSIIIDNLDDHIKPFINYLYNLLHNEDKRYLISDKIKIDYEENLPNKFLLNAFFNSDVIKLAVPSAVLSEILPINPSEIITSAIPCAILSPSINPL